MRVKLKKQVDVPPAVQAFINRCLSVPLADIGQPLESFAWTYDKVEGVSTGARLRWPGEHDVATVLCAQGDFSQWVALFNRFDEFFETLTTPRQDVGLKFDGSAGPDPPFPLHSCLQVLRVTAILLENCFGKQSYSSYEVRARQGPGNPSVSLPMQSVPSILWAHLMRLPLRCLVLCSTCVLC